MSRIQSPRYSGIQQLISDNKTNALYEPLRSTIMKNSFSQSRIAGQDYLQFDPSHSRLQMSRVSKKMRSLSPQQAQILKKNIYIPINKRLVPTKNYENINGKQFQAIDCEQKFFKPIPQNVLRSNPNIKFGSIDRIVYQFREQDSNRLYNQSDDKLNSNQATFRNLNSIGNIQSRFTSPQFRQSQQTSNIYTNKLQVNQVPVYRRTQNRFNNSSFNEPQVNFQNNNSNTQRNYPVNTDLRQFPSEKALSPLMSRTSFQAGISNNNVGINNLRGYDFSKSNASITNSKGYDFSKSNASSTQSIYKQKKKQSFKYNLFSMLDEPGNTKCKSGCCAQNQIIAKNPTIYEWAQ